VWTGTEQQEDAVGDQGLIVVGVDGSESARKALEFALEEAARRPARVRAVAAFQFPRYWPVAIGMASGMVLPPSSRELAEAAEQAARQTITDATGRVGGGAGAVPVEVRVVEGSPAKVLLEQAAGAELLVVGHRGLGGIASACLGSVGLQCVLHATCPVVVVRSAAAAQAGEARVAVAVGGATA
jgi:nucleotide-binding universal stress UspA family protein